jgi:hypothetical protein
MIICIDNTVLREREPAAAKQRISARISDGGGCSSGLFRPEFQDFCRADEFGG